jgi:CheY-like chemotaxis protein
MDEVTRASIFEPFFTTKAAGKGTGLGLSTVDGIVKQSNGFIRVYSEVGRGTSFRIFLPHVTESATSDRVAPIGVSTSGTETILLAEDNAGLRNLIIRFLQPAGYTVLEAASGDEAMQLLERQEGPVHLLLSDVVMPGMSGRYLAEQIAKTRPGMRSLYMSGYTSAHRATRRVGGADALTQQAVHRGGVAPKGSGGAGFVGVFGTRTRLQLSVILGLVNARRIHG